MAGKGELELRRTAAQMHALAAVRREVRSRDSANGRKYLREFTDAFRQYDSILSSDQLNDKIGAASTLLIGDYHALAASQRFVTELIERLSQGRRVVVGLEAVLSRDQRILDAWWRREIAEAELRRRLCFDRDWGTIGLHFMNCCCRPVTIQKAFMDSIVNRGMICAASARVTAMLLQKYARCGKNIRKRWSSCCLESLTWRHNICLESWRNRSLRNEP